MSFTIRLHISDDYRYGEISRGHGESLTIKADELDEFLAALAADPTPVTLRRWFAKKQPKQARAA